MLIVVAATATVASRTVVVGVVDICFIALAPVAVHWPVLIVFVDVVVIVVVIVEWEGLAGECCEAAVLDDGPVPLIPGQLPAGHGECEALGLLLSQP